MKKFCLTPLLLVVFVAAHCMDDRDSALDRRSDVSRSVRGLLCRGLEHETSGQQLDSLVKGLDDGISPNMATLISDSYGTRMAPALASLGQDISLTAVETLIGNRADVNATVYQKERDSEFYKPMPLLAWFVWHYLKLDEQFADIIKVRQIIRQLISGGACVNDCLRRCLHDIQNKSKYCHTLTQGPLMVHTLRAQENPFSRLVDAIDRSDCADISVICSKDGNALINQRDDFGFTPLAYALLRSRWSRNLNPEVILALICLGARGQEQLWKGEGLRFDKCALDIAVENNWNDIIQLLTSQEQEELRKLLPADFECGVCLNKADQTGELRGLACGHIFCKKCVQGLAICPFCRAPIS